MEQLRVFGFSGLHPFVQVGVGSLGGPQMNPSRNGLERERGFFSQACRDGQF